MPSVNSELRIVNICPLLPGHMREMADDLKYLHKECGVTDVAFMVPLVLDTAEINQDKAKRFRELLNEIIPLLTDSGLRIGILIQSTLGHGTASDAPFTRSVNAKGMTTASMCPADPGVRAYVREAIGIIAEMKPAFMLIDDDFRLANYGAEGCFCELHLEALAKQIGKRFEREELFAAIEHDTHLREQWDNVRMESLLGMARDMRAAIDAADPLISCGYCVCDAGGTELQFAHGIERILAGDNPPFVRIGNAMYWQHNPLSALGKIYWTAAQLEAFSYMPELLAESDTYPQNRHYTSAKQLNYQIMFSLLSGCTGLKLWITRLGEYQPESGAAYRRMLKTHIAAYQEVCRLTPHTHRRGAVTPLITEEAQIPSSSNNMRSDNWACLLLARIGIPVRVGTPAPGDTVMLTGAECDYFTDAQLRAFASGALLLDGSAALKFCQRGMGELLGVKAEAPEKWKCSFEKINSHPLNASAAGKKINIAALSAASAVKLIPFEGAEVLSSLFLVPFVRSVDEWELCPGLTLFRNTAGGRVAVYAAALGHTAFYDENRRVQLYGVLEWLNNAPLPPVMKTDIDVYAINGKLDEDAGGGELLALFNLSLDDLDELCLSFGEGIPEDISLLEHDGSWRNLSWTQTGACDIVIQERLNCADINVLRIRRGKN
ncbi:MAG: hypothetical protein JXR78_13755 [Victivallales bacterium]|nr:hypothetical protein [Victivallales bacterium]